MYFIKALVASKVLLLGAVVYAATSSQGGAYQSHDDEIDNGFGAPLNGSQGGGAGLLPRFAVAADGFTDGLALCAGPTQKSPSSLSNKKPAARFQVGSDQEQPDGSKTPFINLMVLPTDTSGESKVSRAVSEEDGFCRCLVQLYGAISNSRCIVALSEWIATDIFDKPYVELEFSPGLLYWVKRWVYVKFLYIDALRNLSNSPTIAPPGNDKEDLVPWTKFGVPISNLYTARELPRAERTMFESLGSWITVASHKYFPLTTGNLPPIPADPELLMILSYPMQYRQLMPVPVIPSQLSDGADDLVSALALEGPFAINIQRIIDASSDDFYEIDFSFFEQFPVKEGLCSLGGRALLKYNPDSSRLYTVSIEYDDDEYLPGSEEWPIVQKIMQAALMTKTVVIDHLLHAHLAICGTFSAVNNRYLSASHPLRKLMNMHQQGTLTVNNEAVPVILGFENAFAPAVFSYDSATFNKIVALDIDKFDISTMDIVENLKYRQMLSPDGQNFAIPYPAGQNLLDLYNILHTYVGNFLNLYYDNDAALANDEETKEWLDQLNTYIPNGVDKYVGEISKASIQKLITLFVYTATVEHTRAGRAIFNYTLWPQYIPPYVRLDGKAVSIGVHQEGTNIEFISGVLPLCMLDDFSPAEYDEREKAIVQQLTRDMAAYQTELNRIGIHSGTICPENIAPSLNE